MDLPMISKDAGEDLAALYNAAFPEEDLLSLLAALRDGETPILSLIANRDGTPLGNIIFTLCNVGGATTKAALLGPLAVVPEHQRRGIGSSLIQRGLEELRAAKTSIVFVLGDPTYYRRFGFNQQNDVKTPHPIPNEWVTAWQSLSLDDHPALSGVLGVPTAWNDPALWS